MNFVFQVWREVLTMASRRKQPMKWTADRIKALRESYGETQEEFRHRFPISISTIRLIETTGAPSPQTCTILDYLDAVPMEDRRQLQSA
jgi:DNA-binding transcriptional regulator YiaG